MLPRPALPTALLLLLLLLLLWVPRCEPRVLLPKRLRPILLVPPLLLLMQPLLQHSA
jgi:hypothetical protein